MSTRAWTRGGTLAVAQLAMAACAFIKGEVPMEPLSTEDGPELAEAEQAIARRAYRIRGELRLQKLIGDIRTCLQPSADYDDYILGDFSYALGGAPMVVTSMTFAYVSTFSAHTVNYMVKYDQELDKVQVTVIQAYDGDELRYCALGDWTAAEDVAEEAAKAKRRAQGELIEMIELIVAWLGSDQVGACVVQNFTDKLVERAARRVIDDDELAERIADIANSASRPEGERAKELLSKTLIRELEEQHPELVPLVNNILFLDCLLKSD